jgi:hypothetical protein
MPGRRHPHRQRPRPTNLPSLKKGQLCRSTWKSFPVRRAPHEGGFSGGPARSACHAGFGARSHHSASDAMGQAPTSTSDSRCRSTSRCSRTPTLRRALRRHGPVPRLRRRLRLHPGPAPALSWSKPYSTWLESLRITSGGRTTPRATRQNDKARLVSTVDGAQRGASNASTGLAACRGRSATVTCSSSHQQREARTDVRHRRFCC